MITFSATTILVLALIAALIVAVGVWAYSTANRLDRLHVRGDQARHALEAALARRAVVARSVALALATAGSDAVGEQARRLHALADRAERADWTDRETAENQLAAALTGIDITLLPPQLVAELADAEARVLIARRFHNDAVRDTLALRTRRPVRLLHLGGTAPLPTYFEIAERVTAAATTGLEVDTVRTSARVVLLDEQDRVLLMRGHDPKTPDLPFWFTVGGGIEPGRRCARPPCGSCGRRRAGRWTPRHCAGRSGGGSRSSRSTGNWSARRNCSSSRAPRRSSARGESDGVGTTLRHRQQMVHRRGHREIGCHGETVYPYHLDQLLPEAAAVAGSDAEPEVRSIR